MCCPECLAGDNEEIVGAAVPPALWACITRIMHPASGYEVTRPWSPSSQSSAGATVIALHPAMGGPRVLDPSPQLEMPFCDCKIAHGPKGHQPPALVQVEP